MDQEAIKDIFRRIHETKATPSFIQKNTSKEEWDRVVKYAQEKQDINIHTEIPDGD